MKLVCTRCNTEYELRIYGKCKKCGGILRVEGYSYDSYKPDLKYSDMWRYRNLLPVSREDCIISLAEGGTPTLKSNKTNLYFKLESCNPTGSFKDRGVSVMVSKALEEGLGSLAIASSGNASAAVAAYAAKAELEAIVFVPKTTPDNKISQAVFYGANVYKIDGKFTDCYRLAQDVSLKNGYMNATTTFINPYNYEGNKTIAYEVYDTFQGDLPEYIFIPLGAGPILYGIFAGFQDLINMKRIDRMPKLIGVQTSACAPIARAYKEGVSNVEEWNFDVQTVASAIADTLCTYSDDGTLTLEAIHASEGMAIALEEEEILEWQSRLAKEEGVFCEPSSAVSYAGYHCLLEKGLIDTSTKSLCLITGNGLKQKIETEIITYSNF